MRLQKQFASNRYTCYACAIMPDHVHLVIRKASAMHAETMIENFQNESRRWIVVKVACVPTGSSGVDTEAVGKCS